MSIPTLLTGLGATLAVFLPGVGSSFACAHAGLFAQYFNHGKMGFLPLVISGTPSILGVLVSILLCGKMNDDGTTMTDSEGYRNLSAGLTVGLTCLCSGFGMGWFLKGQTISSSRNFDARSSSIREGLAEPLMGTDHELPFFEYSSISKTIVVLIFHEAIGLYGLIIALILCKQ